MPCDASYMNPTAKERRLQETAQLIVYVYQKRNKKAPIWICKAAKDCYCSANKVVPHLCDILKTMDKKEMNQIVYNAKNKTSRMLADWWEEHLLADNERIREEKHEKRRVELKEQALSKLTLKERRVLGV